MQPSSSSVSALTLAAFDALRTGNARGAFDRFNEIVAQGDSSVSVLLGLAAACSQLENRKTSLATLDKVLALEPTNLRALLMKGDHFLEFGDSQAAIAFYMSALRMSPASEMLSPGLRDDLRKAQKTCEDYSEKYEAFLHDFLEDHGFDPARSSTRFAQSVELMMGKQLIYHQQPQHFYFPELPQIQFYERSQFPWLGAIESASADMRSELQEILREPDTFAPYVESYRNRPNIDATGTVENPNWSAFFLWKAGAIVPENAARCPKTLQALKEVPLCHIRGRTPSILFSLLRPGAKIPPHTGMINTRLICHIPLIVPEKCGFRVGNQTREWVERKALVFDDTIEHEAWNNSGDLRVVLIFDIWRPELTEEERGLVAAMLEAVDAYRGRPQWRE